MAGRLGSKARFKIDVFGPVVNLASRLEGITKKLRVPILIDEATVHELGADLGGVRLRRLARLRPYGMAQPVTVSEVLPPPGEEDDVLSDADVERYEAALQAFDEGRWDDAFAELHAVPHWDRGKDFLTSHILEHQREPPPGWDGIIQMASK